MDRRDRRGTPRGAHYSTDAKLARARRRRRGRTLRALLAVVAALAIVGLGAFWWFRSQAQLLDSRPDAGQRQAAAPAEPAPAEPAATPLEEGRIVMTLGGDAETYVRQGEQYLEAGCHVMDRQEGDLTSRCEASGNVDTQTPGDYTVTYTVKNDAGMVDACQRVVHVVADAAMEWNSNGVPVMMYHYVYDPANPPESLDANYISTTDLEAQLQWLTSEGWYFPSWQELRAYIDGTHSLPAKSVILSFDDGEYGFLDNGIPLLERYQVPATSFVECSREDIQNVLVNYANPYVSFQSHSFALHHAGYTPLGHGGKIFDLSEDELVDDLTQAERVLGTSEAFAYPYGDVSDVSAAAVDRAGILCAVTTAYGRATVGTSHAEVPRVRVSGGNSLEGWVASVRG